MKFKYTDLPCWVSSVFGGLCAIAVFLTIPLVVNLMIKLDHLSKVWLGL